MAEGQEDKKRLWQTGRKTGREDGRRAGRQEERMADGQEARKRAWQTVRKTGREYGRQAGRQEERMSDGQEGMFALAARLLNRLAEKTGRKTFYPSGRKAIEKAGGKTS
jgi:hypothetical protein